MERLLVLKSLLQPECALYQGQLLRMFQTDMSLVLLQPCDDRGTCISKVHLTAYPRRLLSQVVLDC
jgi:hypothetical protein